MAKPKKRDDLSPFELAARHAEADLMAVAELFVNAAEAVAKGDMGRMDALLEKMGGWRQMLAIRHATRMEELRALDDAKPKRKRALTGHAASRAHPQSAPMMQDKQGDET